MGLSFENLQFSYFYQLLVIIIATIPIFLFRLYLLKKSKFSDLNNILKKRALSTFFCLFCTIFFYAQASDFVYWKKNNSQSNKKITHQAWNDFLQKYIQEKDGIHLLPYARVSVKDKKKLQDYIQFLEGVRITEYHFQEQKAYWINLYNALTVQVVLQNYPVDSIRSIKLSSVFIPGPWRKKLVVVEKRALSLDDIEHQILRPIWKDNRVHYAVNCASIGCPNLQKEAFTRENIEALLEKGALEYIQHSRGVHFKEDELIVSSIYKWFEEDFSGSREGVLEHLSFYSTSSMKKKLKGYSKKLKYNYDWSLNE